MSVASRLSKKPLYRLPPLPTPADLLRFYRLRATKQLSQNFLLDPKICSKFVRSSGSLKGAHVIEVGPGPGCLTRPIFEQGAESVVVIEKDKRFMAALELLANATNNKLKIVHGDVLNSKLEDLIPAEKAKPWEGIPPNIHLIGNLPFSISTILIIKWLHMISRKSSAWQYGRVRMTLSFQKEVAERITSRDVNPERCRLSVIAQGYCYVKNCFTIRGGAFVPPPEVDVNIVRFVPRVQPIFRQPFDLVEKVLRCLFNQKRKTLKILIKNLIPENLQNELAQELLQRSDVDPTCPPVVISVEDYSKICDAYAGLCKEVPGLYEYDFRSPRILRHLHVEPKVLNAASAMQST
ncbi:dimethyladenosine transferase 1, mitochondrial-like [Varroa jacobsoni]|uniref:dimethyladenosine transferase 1, mitochondrial-like n=1 Tax=Varroa jacobsoni TaxID=62625 RepID=UPI000BF5AEF2|nr:dimethyladenosine transferase 1, mitochondrial-like [Varroa jacobsoni]XP_022693967.1 dimethyladenosine transferase 1, mitochondrial-like [Varroa jacobsoni]XP_022693975.1 dimethyladenosine transferase 1, mitochondrial-like [Varroa jacobsoni]XP_022693980.1 dimethyladenosine transferase 1, mitochondrial-like [Varroa jacobsoni]XP_022693985.1 dimethyladenosine transferase 1, mitochondrial-like [Varroa jacobsoni]